MNIGDHVRISSNYEPYRSVRGKTGIVDSTDSFHGKLLFGVRLTQPRQVGPRLIDYVYATLADLETTGERQSSFLPQEGGDGTESV